jgi:glycosyltransferase involved in cell wall biosynthesis
VISNCTQDSMTKTTQPTITTLVRTYNTGHMVHRAFESIFAQDSNITNEVLVLDDGSTDDTVSVLARYGDRIRIIQENHTGGLALLNKGIEYASGEFFLVVDSDDALLPEALSQLHRALKDNYNAGFVIGDYIEEDMDTGEPTRVSVNGNVLQSIVGGVLFRLDLLKKAGGFDASFFFPEYDLFLKLGKLGYSGFFLTVPVYTYSRRVGSMTTESKDRVEKGKKQLMDKWGPLEGIRNY